MKKKYKNFQELIKKYPSLKTKISVEKTLTKKGFNVVVHLGSFDYQSDASDCAIELLKNSNNTVEKIIDNQLDKTLKELSHNGLIKFKEAVH